MKKLICVLFIFVFCKTYGQNNTIETSGDILYYSIPTATLTSTLILKDKKGTFQFSKGLLLTGVVTTGLKYLIAKERPNGKNNLSFPSGHTSTVFQSAAFIQKRYGWKYAIPVYVLSAYTGYSRIQSKNHDLVDVTAGAIIGIGSAYLFTSRLEKNNIKTMFSVDKRNQNFMVYYTF